MGLVATSSARVARRTSALRSWTTTTSSTWRSVDTCELTANRDLASSADMILYKDHYIPTGIRRPNNSKQVSMLYYLECPYHTQNVKVPDAINWTATYRWVSILKYLHLIAKIILKAKYQLLLSCTRFSIYYNVSAKLVFREIRF